MKPITRHADFVKQDLLSLKIKQQLRKPAVWTLAQRRSITHDDDFIAFPYYHHVFDDERRGFRRQLMYLKNYGDFISMDDACSMIMSSEQIKGRYFCVSFDDGFQNCYTNMLGITAELDVPVIIYLPVRFMGIDVGTPKGFRQVGNFYSGPARAVPFLTWDQCREMLNHKVSFGSHTVDHCNLSLLNENETNYQLAESKKKVEQELGEPCHHFACPFGTPYTYFDPATIARIAQRLNYTSVATTLRGKMYPGDDLFLLKRDHLQANWGNHELKYFFGK